MAETTQTDKSLPERPVEGTNFLNDVNILELSIRCHDSAGEKAVNLSTPLEDNGVIQGYLTGMSKVHWESFELRFSCSAKGQTVQAAFTSINSVVSIDSLMGFGENFVVTSNEMNYGNFHTHKLVVPGIYTRQIQPASSEAPRMKLLLKADKGVKVWLHVRMRFEGPIRRCVDLN